MLTLEGDEISGGMEGKSVFGRPRLICERRVPISYRMVTTII